jgi:hypothetical protein
MAAKKAGKSKGGILMAKKRINLAHQVYLRERQTSIWFAKALYEDACAEWANPHISKLEQVHAWQTIMGLTAVLKERYMWDYKRNAPVPDSSLKTNLGLPSAPGGYKSLTPGTSNWLAYWRAHPDEQPDMVQWRSDAEKLLPVVVKEEPEVLSPEWVENFMDVWKQHDKVA